MDQFSRFSRLSQLAAIKINRRERREQNSPRSYTENHGVWAWSIGHRVRISNLELRIANLVNRRQAQTSADSWDHLEAESELFADENYHAHYHPPTAQLYTRRLGFFRLADCSQVLLYLFYTPKTSKQFWTSADNSASYCAGAFKRSQPASSSILIGAR